MQAPVGGLDVRANQHSGDFMIQPEMPPSSETSSNNNNNGPTPPHNTNSENNIDDQGFVFEFKSDAEKRNDQKMRESLGGVGGFCTSVLKSPLSWVQVERKTILCLQFMW
ncbi:hypothetical protein CMV_004767 [Castanea mollissima]|uniref:Uncharacterized protein n=1 Tax=Castanea mollissima TaxID=60419 RepID=A0A8J4RNN5_9ROSI|nr:hypothetical protein CMV_004767 [Castanea mollissima]